MTILASVRNSKLELDERGLVRLDVARQFVQRADSFTRGKWLGGIWESERLWACLMSLEDAQEFVREATRLEWRFHPRASQNLEPLERYRAEIFPWLRSRVKDDVLINVPSCVVPLLCALGTQEAFDLLLRVKVANDVRSPGPFSPEAGGDADALSASEELAMVALQDFCTQNPTSFSGLYDEAASGNQRAQEVLARAAREAPSRVFEFISEQHDQESVREQFAKFGLSPQLTEADVLAALDAGSRDGGSWPIFRTTHPDRAYHSMHLLVFRQKAGDGFWVVFETLEGSDAASLCLKRYVHSSTARGILNRSGEAELFLDGEWDPNGDNVVVGPMGDEILNQRDLLGLEPERATADDVGEILFTLLVRGYLERNPRAFWSDEGELRRDLAFEGIELQDHEVLLHAHTFEHVVGTAGAEMDPEGIDTQWRKPPSESPVFQSLARAIVKRDASLFQPGQSNLDWRLHLDAPKTQRRL